MFNRTKKVITVIMLCVFFSAPVHAVDAEESLFTDVNIGDEHYVAIKYLKEKGIIDGYEDGSFDTRREINRAEALKILSLAFPKSDRSDGLVAMVDELPPIDELPIVEPVLQEEINPEQSELPFTDVNESDWFYSYILESWQNNIINGYPDGNFRPGQTINRAESLKIALLQEGNTIPETVETNPYSDVPSDAWFAPYAQVSQERTLFFESRNYGNLYPDENINRGVFSELIYRIIKSKGETRFARTTWYGNEFANWGTASGEKFDPDKFTVAHKTLPFGTRLQVINLANNEKVEVVVNDRGPYAGGVDLDLSRAAFEEIASLGAGIINAEYKEIPNMPEYAF